MDRRSFAKSLTGAGILSIAGCSSLLEDSGVVLGKISVFNLSYSSNNINIFIIRDGETIFNRDISLPSVDDENGVPGTIIQPTWSRETRQYRVNARHIDDEGNVESLDTEYTFTRQDYEKIYPDKRERPECIAGVIRIGNLSERENEAIGIGPTHMDDPC